MLIVERNMKAAKDYVAKVKAEKEAQAKAEAEAAAQTQAQSGSGLVANRSGTSGRNYQPKTRSNYRQGKARSSHNYKAHPRARRGGGGGDLSYDDIRRRSAELDRAERARNVPERDTSGVIVCVGGNC